MRLPGSNFITYRLLPALAILLFTASAFASGPYVDILHQFGSYTGDGLWPGGIIFDKAGNIYGASFRGGQYGNGAIFELSPPAQPGGSWSENILYSFTGGSDGFGAQGPVVMDAQGNLYGTTAGGGSGWGLVFELVHNSDGTWSQSLLHSFTGGSDGGGPTAELMFNAAGNLLGATSNGGDPTCLSGCGVVFELTLSSSGWTENVLHSFHNDAGGYGPTFSLTLHDGKLYGTTQRGANFTGTVFELSPHSGGWSYSVLYTFGSDGSFQYSKLLADATGNLFFTTADNGTTGMGTIDELLPPGGGASVWTKQTIYSFDSSVGTDGSNPRGVILDKQGNLYGTTLWGGDTSLCTSYGGCGTVYKLTNQNGTWTKTIIYEMRGRLLGPDALVFGPGNALYGTAITRLGHPNQYGAVFKLYGLN